MLLGLLLVSTVVGLSALGEARLEVYVSLFTVCYFVATALYQPRKKGFDLVGVALFTVFCAIVVRKVLEILA